MSIRMAAVPLSRKGRRFGASSSDYRSIRLYWIA